MHRHLYAIITPLVAAVAVTAVGDASPPSVPADASALPGEGFTPVGEQKGVKIYRRDKRQGIELAGEGIIPGAPDRVRRVLLDYSKHATWNAHLKESRILRREEASLDVYERLDLPLLDDRDYTLHVVWGQQDDVLWMRFSTANDRGPAPVRGVVRVSTHEGSWRLSPVDGGKSTRAVYRFYLDLGGSFPAWMGKGQAISDVAELFMKIANQLPRYP